MTLLPLDRTVAVFDGDEIVGNLGDFPLQLTVPGGAQLPMAGMTMVGVRADRTRQGILRSMVNTYLRKAADRGDPLAGLWASEPGIYGRFGFGLATECHDVKIDNRHLQMAQPADTIKVSMIKANDLPSVVAPFWAAMATKRPGFLNRGPERWDNIIADPEHRRGPGSALRHVIATSGDDVVGYLSYRQIEKWNDFIADGSIAIQAMVGETNEAEYALWHYASNIDLFPNISFWDGATDDALAYSVSNARSVQRKLADGLYVRILDLGAALSDRTYETDGELVLRISDDLDYAAGTYRMQVTGGVAEVGETTDAPDVALDVRTLGALYLGRVCVDQLARLGEIEGEDLAVRRLGHLFATARAPWCPYMF